MGVLMSSRQRSRSAAAATLERLRGVRRGRALLFAALAICVAVGFALRAQQAAGPAVSLSADERAYGRIALALSIGHGYGDSDMRDPYQWAPGAPALFAIARRIGPDDPVTGFRVPAARWAQAIAGTLLIAVAFALAALIAGNLAGLLAAAAVALYPPLAQSAAHQLSEPLGALLLAAGCAALAWAARTPRRGRMVLCGALLGLTVLTRADLLLTPLLAAAVVATRIGGDARGRLRAAATLLGTALVVITPWIVTASLAEGRLVPVSDGGASALYVGTYLPGGGTLTGAKRELAAETRRRVPETRHMATLDIPAEKVLAAVALRHPELPERVALRRAAFDNVRTYALGRPVAFASMLTHKIVRMWLRPTRARRFSPAHGIAVHLLLLGVAVLGLLAGLWHRRDPVLILIAAIVVYSTLDNAILIAEPRHNLPLAPILYAAGAAGWALAIGGRRGWSAHATATAR